MDFTHYKMYAETAQVVAMHGTWNGMSIDGPTYLAARLQHLEISHGVNLTSINAQYRWRPEVFAKNTLETHVGAGVLVYLPHAEGTVNDVDVSHSYRCAGTGGQLFGGAEYGLSRHFGVMAEGKFDFGSLDITLDPQTRVETQLRTLHFISGIVFHP